MGLVVKTFNKGEVIINEGDIGKSVYRLVEGEADVIAEYGSKEPFRLAVLSAGDYFGEMAIFEEAPRSATVVARGNVRVLEILENELEDFMSENPDVILELINHLGNKIQAMVGDYNEAQALLSNLREADAGKKQSLFSKIKKHIDLYQSNKTEIAEPDDAIPRKLYEDIYRTGEHNVETIVSGTVIYKEDDSSDALYILHDGKVSIYNNKQLQSELSPIAVFGEVGLMDDSARTTTAVAESAETLVEIIKKDELESVFRSCPEKITLILRLLSNRLRRLNIDFLNICKEITEKYGE